jgi:integrase
MAIREYTDSKGKRHYRAVVDMGATMEGRRDRKSVSCTTLREARQVELELRMRAHGMQGRSNRITLSHYIDTYFLPDKEAILRKNTLAGYRRDIELRIRPALGRRLIGDISHSIVQRLVSSCPTRKTAQNTRDTLRCILSHAVNDGLLAHNPAAGRLKLPERIAKPGQFGQWVSTFSEHRAIIELSDNDEIEALLVLGMCLGLRKGEILGLDWEDMDFAAREVHVRQTYTYTKGAPDLDPPKTPQSRRTVPMTDYAFARLSRLQSRGGVMRIKGPVVTHAHKRMTPRRATSVIEAFRKRHPDVPHITATTLRHSFATASVLSGVNVASLSKWLGHADITTTLNRYVRPLASDLREEAVRIDAAYGLAPAACGAV